MKKALPRKIFLAPGQNPVMLYDADGKLIGTMDPVTRERTPVAPGPDRVDPVAHAQGVSEPLVATVTNPKELVQGPLRLLEEIAGPVRKLQRRYWEKLGLAAFGITQ